MCDELGIGAVALATHDIGNMVDDVWKGDSTPGSVRGATRRSGGRRVGRRISQR
jgi:hypothetical protein